MHELFFEVAIAPAFEQDALAILQQKRTEYCSCKSPVRRKPRQLELS
jgi:AICAR transformylase/IMP cyclohydrolase PurH